METERPRRKRVSQAELDRLAEQNPAQEFYDFDPPAQRIERRRPEPVYTPPPRTVQPEWKRRAIENAAAQPKPAEKTKPRPKPAPKTAAYGAPRSASSAARKPAAKPAAKAAKPAPRGTGPAPRTAAKPAPRRAAAPQKAAAPSAKRPPAKTGAQRPTTRNAYARAGAQGTRYGAPPRRNGGSGGGQRRRGILPALLVLVVLFAGVGMGGMYVLDVKNTLAQGEGVFYPNLYINDIAIGGMTQQEAYDAVSAQVVSSIGAWSVSLVSNGAEVGRITPSTINMRYDVGDQINQLWNVGRTGSTQERYQQVKALQMEPVKRYTTLAYDLSGIDALLMEIKAQVDTPAVDAQRIPDSTRVPPFTYTDETVGYVLDTSSAHEEIMGMVDRLESGTVALTPQVIQPSVTRAQLQSEIVLLSTYKTPLRNNSGNTEGRLANVAKGCEYFNGMVVKAGESVSFNKVTGKRTQKNGWYPALEIAYGEYVEGYGGGICQVSSTLYNAVVGAGLEIVKRTNHGLVVGYLEKGLDATVADNGPDFVFKNNTGADIYIQAESEGKGKNCVFRIYGRPDPNGYTYKLETEVAETLPIPEPEYREDKEQKYVVYVDEEPYVYKKGEEGYKVNAYLVTYQNGNPISREYRYQDTYKAVKPIYYVGTQYRD
ncbi:VanW family protein [Beduinella massiliensis]|uniref:VanW family protein n=1 Tax=Beduinella massiliensis TaxID=1852363 RepID=UPI000C8654B0